MQGMLRMLNRLVYSSASSVDSISSSCSSGGDGSNCRIIRGRKSDSWFWWHKTGSGVIICNGDRGVTYSDGILDVLRSCACAQNVSGQIGRVLRSIFGKERAEVALIANEVTLIVDDTTKIGEDGGARTATTFCYRRWF